MFRIREIREMRHMTQEELGNAIGVSRENISRYESGQRIPPSDRLLQIARALNCSLDDLVVMEPETAVL